MTAGQGRQSGGPHDPGQSHRQRARLNHFAQLLGKFGSDGRDRTYDQLINSQLLYR